MKKLLTILCLVLLVSCSNEIPDDQLVERQGTWYEVNSTKPFTGTGVGYHKNGQVKYKFKLKRGKWSLVEEFYNNGQLYIRTNFKNGEPDGLVERYHENGQLRSKLCYIEGETVDMSYCTN